MNGHSAPNRKTVVIAASVVGGLLLVAGGGATAYAVNYADRALPGATVAGVDVGGLERAEIIAQVQDRAAAATITTEILGSSTTSTLEELGVTIDAEATANAVLAPNTSILNRFTALFGSRDYEIVFTRDEAALQQLTKTLAAKAGDPVAEATVVAGDDGVFVATEAKPGKTIDEGVVVAAVDAALVSLQAQTVALEPVDVEPTVSTEEAQAVAVQANALISPEVVISDGLEEFTASLADKAKWVTIPDNGGELGTPTIDTAKALAWVEALGVSTNVAPVAGIDNVDAAGNVLVHAFPGKPGLTVNNASAVADAMVASLNEGSSYRGEFDYSEVPASNETRQVLPGAEAYAYPAAAGEKWIDIDLSRNTVTAYEGLDIVHGPIAVNHGKPGDETVTGTYNIYLKFTSQDMGCGPGWSYCAEDVPWVMYFTGSYALHGAPWVAQFGLGSVNGSHGCVNLPVGEANWLYNWSEIGTPVVSHY